MPAAFANKLVRPLELIYGYFHEQRWVDGADIENRTDIDDLNLYGDFLKLYCTMMKRNLVLFATVVMNVCMAMAQGFSAEDAAEFDNMNFEWNAKVVKAAPAAKTTTRTVSVRQLAQASARRNSSSTASTRSTRRAAQQTYAAAPVAQNVVPQNDVQQQLNSAIAANSSQRVICGTVEHNYINDINGTTTLIVRTAGFGGSIKKFTMRGYKNFVIPVYAGDYVAFVVTYGMNSMDEYPIVNYNELVNVTGTNRYLQEYADHYYGGDTAMMLASTPGASKWQRTVSTIASGAMTVASVAMLAKEVISWFK